MRPYTRWQVIDGWLTVAEGDALQSLAEGQLVLELGSYLGRSTVAMAKTALHVVAVDWHIGDEHAGRADTLVEFRENLRTHAVSHKVSILAMDFVTAGALLEPGYDLVFVDGQHDYASAHRDTLVAARMVRPGGIIAWHDYHGPFEVERAVRDAGFTPRDRADSLAWGVVGDAPGS